MSKQVINVKARYTTNQAAELCDVRDHSTIAKWIREACEFDTESISRYSIAGTFVRFMREYRYWPHTFRSQNRQTFGEWLDEHNHRRPRIDQVTRTELVSTAKSPQREAVSQSGIKAISAEVRQLRKKVEQLERRNEVERATVGERSLKALPAPSEKRKRLSKRVASFVYGRTGSIGYQEAWEELYARFFEKVGPPDLSWWSFQLHNDTKLDWFEREGLIDLLVDCADEIFDAMSKKHPPNKHDDGQGELAL